MTKHRQFLHMCQSACIKRLPMWRKHRRFGLYRRTDDFVQWLLFQSSSFDNRVRPSYAIQALAEQIPAETITLGAIARTSQSTELWFGADDWEKHQTELTELILAQIEPRAFIPLTAESILMYLYQAQIDHVSAFTTRGIASIVVGNTETGRQDFQYAYDAYQGIDASWARVEEQRIQSWLACSDTTILAKLRADAQAGAALLKLT